MPEKRTVNSQSMGTVIAVRGSVVDNSPKTGAIYTPVNQRLLPLDDDWRRELAATPWPTGMPEVMNDREQTLLALVREYLFVSLFRACAESLASENASRLAAMQRAEKKYRRVAGRLES